MVAAYKQKIRAGNNGKSNKTAFPGYGNQLYVDFKFQNLQELLCLWRNSYIWKYLSWEEQQQLYKADARWIPVNREFTGTDK